MLCLNSTLRCSLLAVVVASSPACGDRDLTVAPVDGRVDLSTKNELVDIGAQNWMDSSQITDLSTIVESNDGGVTGAPCKTEKGCLASSAPGASMPFCTANWPDGYCQSPCRVNLNDLNGINETDCTGQSPVCVPGDQGLLGVCYAGCKRFADCRQGYVCAALGTKTGSCVPLATSDCDPDFAPVHSNKACPNGTRCVNRSPDISFGRCAVICDPLAQGCPPSPKGPAECLVDYSEADGSGECWDIFMPASAEGDSCIYLNGCQAGLQCYEDKCRRYCRLGVTSCPQNQTCQDIFVGNGIPAKVKADKIGICRP